LVSVFLVVFFIFSFTRFYMNTSVSPRFFLCYYFGFFFFMVCMIHGGSWYVFLLGWEMMRVLSFLLISWFNSRPLARNGASLAFISNRFRDVVLFRGLLCGCNLSLLFLAGMTKSSMWVFSSWLPNAMEGPTPVSTLLHSSTMVVAGVFLLGAFNYLGYAVSLVFLYYRAHVGFLGARFSDYKRIVAYSTSSQLALVGLISLGRSESQSLFYVEAHALFKSLLFMLCGWMIHANYVQFVLSFYNYYTIGGAVVLGRAVMCRIPFLSVARVKDVFLVGTLGLFFVVSFLHYAFRTVMYSSRLLRPHSGEPLGFMEGGTIVSLYLAYLILNYFVVELFGTRVELGGLCFFLVPLFIVLSIAHVCLSRPSVDFYYKVGSLGHMSHVFGGHHRPNYGLKESLRTILLCLFFL